MGGSREPCPTRASRCRSGDAASGVLTPTSRRTRLRSPPSSTPLSTAGRNPRAKAQHRREAEGLYRHAISVFARRLGKAHFEVGFNLGQLAALLQSEGRLAEASRLYMRALPIQERVLGRHPQLATTLWNFAALRVAQARPSEASAAYRKARAIYGVTVGKSHPDTLACAERIAVLAQARRAGDRAPR